MKHSSKKSTNGDADSLHGGQDMKPMPSLVFNEVHFDTQEAEPGEYQSGNASADEDLHLIHQSLNYRQNHTPLLPTNNPPPAKGAWGIIWLAVGAVMAVVVGVWIYGLPGRLSLSSWQETGEYKLLRAAKERWGTNFSSTSTGGFLGSEDLSPLSQAITNLNASSSPTSTTTNTVSTSPSPSSSSATTTQRSSSTLSTSSKK